MSQVLVGWFGHERWDGCIVRHGLEHLFAHAYIIFSGG